MSIFIYYYPHHHVTLSARISLTLSRHPSLSSIAPGTSSRLYPISAQSCMYVLAGRPPFVRPCEGVYRSILLMISPLLLQQCLACLVRLTWIVFVIGGRGSYSCCFVGVASRNCSLLMAFLCNFRQAFSPYIVCHLDR